MLACRPCDKATPPTLAPGCAHSFRTCALKAWLYSRRRGRLSFANCSIVSTILPSWTRCTLASIQATRVVAGRLLCGCLLCSKRIDSACDLLQFHGLACGGVHSLINLSISRGGENAGSSSSDPAGRLTAINLASCFEKMRVRPSMVSETMNLDPRREAITLPKRASA